MEHTKGKWHVETPMGDIEYSIVVDGASKEAYDWRFIGSASFGTNPETDIPIQEAEANAHLMAAAPDLLAALEQMDDLIKKLWDSIPWGKTFDLPVRELNEAPLAAAAALARAKGESR